jgi:hypothetical protein
MMTPPLLHRVNGVGPTACRLESTRFYFYEIFFVIEEAASELAELQSKYQRFACAYGNLAMM